MQVYHGCKVKFHGFKTLESGHTVEAIEYATVIGWDTETIYTDFVLVKDGGNCRYWDPEIITSKMVSKDFRIGFHPSRLIQVLEDVSISINHNLIQSQLFT